MNTPVCATPDYEPHAIKRRVLDGELVFTPAQQQVMRYIWSNPYEAAFGTMASISLACGVGAATLARVADLLGYSGFADFRKAMRANLARPASACQAAPITSSSIEVSPARKRGLPVA